MRKTLLPNSRGLAKTLRVGMSVASVVAALLPLSASAAVALPAFSFTGYVVNLGAFGYYYTAGFSNDQLGQEVDPVLEVLIPLFDPIYNVNVPEGWQANVVTAGSLSAMVGWSYDLAHTTPGDYSNEGAYGSPSAFLTPTSFLQVTATNGVGIGAGESLFFTYQSDYDGTNAPAQLNIAGDPASAFILDPFTPAGPGYFNALQGVPEPTSVLTLTFAGLVGTVVRRRRRA